MKESMHISGTYQVVEYGYAYKKEKKFEPIADWFSGVIHYADTGFMSVIIRFKEIPESLQDVVAYSGTFKVVGDEIVHEVNMSVRPEYEKQILTRKFKILENGSAIELEFENTEEFRKYSIWRRIN